MTAMEKITKAMENKEFAELARNLQAANSDLFANEAKIETLALIAEKYIG